MSFDGICWVPRARRTSKEQRQRQQEAAEDAAALLARTELLHEELLHRWQKQCKQSVEAQQQGRKKLEKSILEGQKEVRGLIKRLRQGGADGETARRAGHVFSVLSSDEKDEAIGVLRKQKISWGLSAFFFPKMVEPHQTKTHRSVTLANNAKSRRQVVGQINWLQSG